MSNFYFTLFVPNIYIFHWKHLSFRIIEIDVKQLFNHLSHPSFLLEKDSFLKSHSVNRYPTANCFLLRIENLFVILQYEFKKQFTAFHLRKDIVSDFSTIKSFSRKSFLKRDVSLLWYLSISMVDPLITLQTNKREQETF